MRCAAISNYVANQYTFMESGEMKRDNRRDEKKQEVHIYSRIKNVFNLQHSIGPR